MDRICKLTLLSSLCIAYIYLMEYFIAWYSGDPYERWVFGHRLLGHTYWYGGWIMLVVNFLTGAIALVQARPAESEGRFRHRLLINIGMWFERFTIIVGSLYQDFLPANWGFYKQTWVDIGTYHGHARRVFHDVSAVHPFPADDSRGRSQIRPAAGRSASSARRREGRQIMSAKTYGLIAEFDSPAAILRAAEKVRDAGYRRWDVFTPFPIHGLDKVMGFKNSLVGWFALVFGGGAFIGTMGLIWYLQRV